jgi:hypothetical protein
LSVSNGLLAALAETVSPRAAMTTRRVGAKRGVFLEHDALDDGTLLSSRERQPVLALGASSLL